MLTYTLPAIDGSYCTTGGGDDPYQDATYPDPWTDWAGAYEGPATCGGYAATKVISTSYSYNEHDLTPAYEQRQCNEYMKLGMMGVTVIYSSGDYGVAGNGGVCINGAGFNASNTDGSSGRFNPSFPGTCPYVTVIGATQIKVNATISDNMPNKYQPEEACETVIFSGGGFSNVFPLPSYQASAVQRYFKNYAPPYSADTFNNSQQTRGYPDFSANVSLISLPSLSSPQTSEHPLTNYHDLGSQLRNSNRRRLFPRLRHLRRRPHRRRHLHTTQPSAPQCR